MQRPVQGEAHGVIQISGGEARATLLYRGGEAFEEDRALVLRQIVGGGHHGRKLIVVEGEHSSKLATSALTAARARATNAGMSRRVQ